MSEKRDGTEVLDLKTSATRTNKPSSFSSRFGIADNQSVASVRNVNDGPKAGFLTVVENALSGLWIWLPALDVIGVALLMTFFWVAREE
jgi:hypothetical protein